MSDDSIYMPSGLKDELDEAKFDLFGTDHVPYNAVVERLLSDHDETEYE